MGVAQSLGGLRVIADYGWVRAYFGLGKDYSYLHVLLYPKLKEIANASRLQSLDDGRWTMDES